MSFFYGDGKQKVSKNKEKEGEKIKDVEEKFIHLGWSSAEFAGMQGNAFIRALS